MVEMVTFSFPPKPAELGSIGHPQVPWPERSCVKASLLLLLQSFNLVPENKTPFGTDLPQTQV